jgi:predicted dehydrogenase
MIKVGIAGFGKIGKIRADEIAKRNDCVLTGIFDIKKPDNISINIDFFPDYEDLINSGIDAIFICTYNNVLADFTIKAINSGIHVFCEKPPARTVKELMQVKENHNNSKVKLKYGFNHRYHYSVMEAKKLIDNSIYGKIIWIRGVYGKAGSIDYNSNWRNYKKFSGGGILIDQGIHMLDLIKFVLNKEFISIKSFIQNSYWKVEGEDNAFAIMKTEDNVIASIHSSATQWRHKFLLEICCENGMITLDGILSKTNSYAPEKLIITNREFEDITFAMGKPKEETVWFSNDDSWFLEVDEFITSIKNDSAIINGTIDDAIETLTLVEKIYDSNDF